MTYLARRRTELQLRNSIVDTGRGLQWINGRVTFCAPEICNVHRTRNEVHDSGDADFHFLAELGSAPVRYYHDYMIGRHASYKSLRLVYSIESLTCRVINS